MATTTEQDPLDAIQFKVDKAGRLTLPKEMRQRLMADAGGVYGWWDGTRLHLASYRELRAALDKASTGKAKGMRTKSNRKAA